MGVKNGPTHIDLFSGIGGFAIAARWAGFRTIAFCEIDKYCQKVLAKNFLADARRECVPTWREAGNVACEARAVETHGEQRERLRNTFGNGCSIISNIFDFDGTKYRGCDLITGGFPCQPFSVAGKRRGAADDRALWPEMFRVISEARPAWVLGENVPGIIGMELDNVLSDLEGIGYATRSFVIPACAVDARHRRDRVWIIGRNMGYSGVTGLEGHGNTEITDSEGRQDASGHAGEAGRIGAVADNGVSIERGSSRTRGRVGKHGETQRDGWGGGRQADGEWLPEPDVGRVVDELSTWLDGPFCTFPPEPNIPRVATGVKNRADRLKGLGNSVVVRLVYEILKPIHDAILLQPDKNQWA